MCTQIDFQRADDIEPGHSGAPVIAGDALAAGPTALSLTIAMAQCTVMPVHHLFATALAAVEVRVGRQVCSVGQRL
jgi:hypothetical protein